MMQAANIPLGHLYSTGIQQNHETSQEELDLVDQLTNPNYVNDKQALQMVALTHDIKYNEVQPELQRIAVQGVNDFVQQGKDLMNKQRNKKALVGDNLIQMQIAKNNLTNKISALQQISKDKEVADKTLTNYIAQGVITPEEVQLAQKRFAESMASAKDPQDVRLLSNLYSEYANAKITKVKAESEAKAFKEAEAVYEPGVKALSKEGYSKATPEQARAWTDANYGENSQMWNYIRNKMIAKGQITEATTDDEARNIFANELSTRIKKLNFIPFNLNQASGTKGNPYKIKFTKQSDGRNYANLGLVPVPYIAEIEGNHVPGKVIGVIDDNGNKTMKFIWTEKPQGLMKQVNVDKNGAIELPLDETIESIIDNGTGVLDYESIGKQSTPKSNTKSAPTKWTPPNPKK